jgi:hypothetical protein
MSHYVRARHYSYVSGLWNTVDPLWPDESAFGYVGGQPLFWIDPTGLNGGQGGSGTIPRTSPPPDTSKPPYWFPKGLGPGPKPGGPPQIVPRPGGSGGGGGIIELAARACADLINYCATGQTGPITGICDAIGRACFDSDGDPPGTRDKSCDDTLLDSLNAAVKRACKSGAKTAYSAGMTNQEMQEIIKGNKECIKARAERDGRCFNGGDPGHKKQIDQLRRSNKCCNYLISGGKPPCPN